MTLYDMLDCTMFYQTTWIFEHNAYDQNMPLFKGLVNDARTNERVWDYLTCKVDHYDCTMGILVIFIKDEYFEEKIEEHYGMSSNRWGGERNKRPWLFSTEIKDDLWMEKEKREKEDNP